MRHWMFDCRSVSRMVSESLDRQLPLSQRIGLRFHLLMCRFCSRYRRQLLQMRELMRRIGDNTEKSQSAEDLPVKARQRIQRALAGAAMRDR